MVLTSDAVVVGSGINGLVAAAELAGAGWAVTLVEGDDRLGGFVRSEERTLPGYVHDTYSSWHSLFVSGGAYAALEDDLQRHGLRYHNTDAELVASVGQDGVAVVASRNAEQTAASFAHPEDTQRYLAVVQAIADHAGPIGGLMGSELRSPALLRYAAQLGIRLGRSGAETWLNQFVSSGRGWCRREFRGTEVDQLWAPWLLHAGLSPDHAGGGFMLPMFAATLHGFGLPVVSGGADGLVQAFRSLLLARGVEIRTGTTIERILVKRGRAVGVVSGEEHIRARRAVIVSVTPTALYGQLLPRASVPHDLVEQAQAYRYGRGSMQVHVALSAPLTWRDERLANVPLIHLSNGSASTGVACAQAEAGLLPDRPTVVVGQQYLLDPTRVPDGAAALWLQLQETPYAPIGDAAGELDVSGGWTEALAKAFSDRVLDRIAEHAPDLRTKILAVDVLTPPQLEAANPNAVCGDPYGGASELDQNFFWRPLRGAASHRCPVEALWHIGASTHPGAGLGAGSGHLVAQMLTTRRGTRGAASSRLRKAFSANVSRTGIQM